jgi:hypothetical protein
MHTAVETLSLETLFVIYPGTAAYPLAPRIHAAPLTALPTLLGGTP